MKICDKCESRVGVKTVMYRTATRDDYCFDLCERCQRAAFAWFQDKNNKVEKPEKEQ